MTRNDAAHDHTAIDPPSGDDGTVDPPSCDDGTVDPPSGDDGTVGPSSREHGAREPMACGSSPVDPCHATPEGEGTRPGLRDVLVSTALGALVAVPIGLGAAAFLVMLAWVTDTREATPALVFGLPVAGVLMGLALQRWGREMAGGSALVLRRLNEGGATLPRVMAPGVVLGTVWTHAFGGSAGREGTAVQMGAAMADRVAAWVGASPPRRHLLLVAGVSAGFSGLFGTPVAATLFAVEWMRVGRPRVEGLVPAAVAAWVANAVFHATGVAHAAYPRVDAPAWDIATLAGLLLVGGACGLAGVAFLESTERLRRLAQRMVPNLALRLGVGGLAVVGLWQLAGTDRYLGLGIPTLLASFEEPGVPLTWFALKILFTAVTLAAGFLGGEVTPLFFVGATLGSALAAPLGLPVPLSAGTGLAAVFGACANTPIALAVMAAELLGWSILPHALLVAGVAFVVTGRRSLYGPQPGVERKWGLPRPGLQSK